jgi:hypothetical protein
LKDTTIETLNAAIKFHEAEIAHLKGDRAPALAAEHKSMKEFADQMAADKQQAVEDKQRLDERVAELYKMVEESTTSQSRAIELMPLEIKLAETTGMLFAWSLLMGSINTYTEVMSSPTPPIEGFFPNFYQRMYEVASDMESRVNSGMAEVDELKAAFKNANPGSFLR